MATVYRSDSESQYTREIFIEQQQHQQQHEEEEEDNEIVTPTSSSSTSEEQQHHEEEEEEEDEVILWKPKPRNGKSNKRVPHICLEGYVEPSDDDDLPRTKSLTDDDLDELKGCLDLGFGFNYDEIPELCNTLPALELCYSMSQKFLDDHPNQHLQSSNGKGVGVGSSDTASSSGSESSSPMPTWKISSPGDHPEDVKARLKFWAQAVACTVKLCS